MGKLRILYFIVLVTIAAIPSLSMFSFSSDPTNCPRLGKDKRPALLFYEGGPDGLHLYVAYQQDGKLVRESIVSARYLELTQLDNAIFLTNTRLSSFIYAMDFNTGEVKPIGEDGMIWCLRAEPARKTAMLIDSRRGSGRDRLIELGLTSLTTTKEQVLSNKELGDEYDRIVHPYKISPDFQQIAYVSKKGGKAVERVSNCELKSLDLRIYKTKVLDDNVRVEISGASSLGNGIPPFEWISNSQVLYQHIIAQESSKESEWSLRPLNGLCVFKIVDIKTGNISECFRKEIRLELEGGTLKADPLTNRLIFNRNFILDYIQNQIVDKNLPFSVSSYFSRKTEIKSASEVLYSGNLICSTTCLSKSGVNFSYLLASGGLSVQSEIYAVFNGSRKPVKVAEGINQMSHPIGWIE
jgi:hypothetical protein